MGIGFWKKIGNFFKGVWNGIKKGVKWIGSKLMPVAKIAAPVVAGAVGGPGAALAAGKVVNTAGNIISGLKLGG
jgi:hypothetical protein